MENVYTESMFRTILTSCDGRIIDHGSLIGMKIINRRVNIPLIY